ncbi:MULTISPECIES: type VII secretion integral membrane protein EccD [unclassified Streptomyces]|uniref:type VII secretion integral membrane protein EccD n=1 Tax=unclassified Streptomyces TaxID=2593676 RepID=UPI002DD863D2|nr:MULTISPECIES: type VII secretion integral membrane protein EccD [unclassified Streptomyces]WSF84097.1 type VII secretion integral membrane protein EccD [Streptomyces sp. NBC_01744]WSC39618.1 type VII secretion integral membrane protein EccD [Streptomyces sp. NBC_01763]WSC47757.1 type VII secretion integral membrane protein EccD [Streptomyces sp. NBC_01762]WSC53255.1 type VII secretion integral membrane protein EccD [Streptomyces sp. NBC_01761]WSD27409.1 type VII secretion integral membrane 
MSTTAATGFCRVTVVAPDSRIDVALPEDIAVADIYPEILRLTGQTQAAGHPTGYHLVRRDGTVLDGARTLAAQQVLDGELLSLRPFAQSLPPAVFDDVSDAVASAVTRDRHLWSDELLRGAGLLGGVLLLVLMGFVLWFADPVRHDMHSLPGIVAGSAGLLLTAFAGVRARVYGDRATAVALGLGALPLVLIAGSGIIGPDAGQGPGRLQFLLGCVAVLVASVVLVALTPSGDAPFVAATFVATVGTLATFVAILTGVSATGTAAVCAPVALGLVAFLPGLSARFARLPIGYASPRTAPGGYDDSFADPNASPEPEGVPVDADRIAAQARRGHEMLLGLVGGCAAVVVGSAAVLGFSGNVWGRLLALAAGLAMLLRARLFRYTSQVACVLVAGIGAVALLILGLSLNPPADLVRELARYGDSGSLDIRTVWLSAAVAAGAALLTAIGLIIPRKGLSPFWGRLLDLTESALLLSLVPLCLAVLDVFARARALTS